MKKKIKLNSIIIVLCLLSSLHANVLTGLDVLEKQSFEKLQNKNIGLVINHTSINNNNNHIIELLADYSNINIKSIFTPEHGLKGQFSAGAPIADAFNDSLGVEIISLYGKRKEPVLDKILDLDYIIFDLQDVGSRYYTYISTLTYVLNAASKANIPVIILDRPNPLGRVVSGPITKEGFQSFVGMHPIPIRHGMTIAELAQMINSEGWLPSAKKADLIIYKIEQWDAEADYFNIPPSPNIPDFETALIYNGMCLLEGTNLSEGRGTETPFLLFGAPWMNSHEIVAELNDMNLKGVFFSEKTFKPLSVPGVSRYPKYENELCSGIKLNILDKDNIDPLKVAIFILKTVHKNHPDQFSFNNNNFISRLYGSGDLKDNIINNESIEKLYNVWHKDSSSFSFKRKPYLLY